MRHEERPEARGCRRDDFDFVVRLRDPTGRDEGFPKYDFKGEIYPEADEGLRRDYGDDWPRLRQVMEKRGIKPYIFSKEGDMMTNCLNDNGRLRVVVAGHQFPGAHLRLTMTYFLPNPIYPGGIQKVIRDYPLDIGGRCGKRPGEIDLEAVVPFVYVSAYELAKANGFEGTEEEFLRALSGIGKAPGIDEETLEALKEWQANKDEYLREDEFEEISDDEIKEAIDEIFEEISD